MHTRFNTWMAIFTWIVLVNALIAATIAFSIGENVTGCICTIAVIMCSATLTLHYRTRRKG